jgi:outer membrane protein assembly factor BamA
MSTAGFSWRARCVRFLTGALVLTGVGGTIAGDKQPALIDVSGAGFFRNRELQKNIKLLLPGKDPARALTANFIEDSALILFAQLSDDGYLSPTLKVVAKLPSGEDVRRTWRSQVSDPLPRPLRAASVAFRIDRGRFYHYDRLTIEDLEVIGKKEAKAYFYQTETLVGPQRQRVFSPGRLEKSMAELKAELAGRGFADATVTATDPDRNDETGAVTVRVEVVEGKPSRIRNVTTLIRERAGGPVASERELRPDLAYSRGWVQDFVQGLQVEQYRKGFPDAAVEVKRTRSPGESEVAVDLATEVVTGPAIVIGEVSFEGRGETKPSVLKRHISLKPGQPLDRTQAELGRHRLSRLGIFDSVGMRFDATNDPIRNVVYELKEGRKIDLSVLFGYGSYELLRGGVELEQFNVFGRAHHARLRAAQSFRASTFDYDYSFPETGKRAINVFLNANALRREEIDFVREEFGGVVGAGRFVPAIDSTVSLRYTHQLLNASEAGEALPIGLASARVASLTFDINHDQLDNPLVPRKGFKGFGSFEFASAGLGGEVDYQRIDVGAAYHRKLLDGLFFHVGLRHGNALTLGGNGGNLPFNKRFFPGGENSIRGFLRGEAAPRNAGGELVGAATYMQGNIELEQLLTRSWSLVVFADGVGFSQNLADYPFDETLFSVGGGIRWKTIIGPARLEYGHNLNPRGFDPSGTLHFSVGYPF